jgi:hypothetical protein
VSGKLGMQRRFAIFGGVVCCSHFWSSQELELWLQGLVGGKNPVFLLTPPMWYPQELRAARLQQKKAQETKRVSSNARSTPCPKRK